MIKNLVKICLSGLFGLALLAAPAMAADMDLENTLYMDLDAGRVVIKMRPDLAPTHVARIKELTRQGFYDGVVFHRVIDGFMAQTGDPTGTGRGGSGQKLNAEFSNTPHARGTVSMARAASLNSADSQFFICFAPSPFLDGKYTVWGEVTEGMEFVDQIKKGDPANNGSVSNPDKIIKMQIAADAAKNEGMAATSAPAETSPAEEASSEKADAAPAPAEMKKETAAEVAPSEKAEEATSTASETSSETSSEAMEEKASSEEVAPALHAEELKKAAPASGDHHEEEHHDGEHDDGHHE